MLIAPIQLLPRYYSLNPAFNHPAPSYPHGRVNKSAAIDTAKATLDLFFDKPQKSHQISIFLVNPRLQSPVVDHLTYH